MTEEPRSDVEIRAFEIWEREGRPHGKALEHWDQAVTEIASEDAKAAKLKKAAGRKKAEKATPAARAKKTASASATKKTPKGRGKKAPK